MKIRIYVISLFLIASSIAFSQSADVFAKADKQKILIGEPLDLNIQVTALKSDTFHWFVVDTIPHFEILSRSKVDSVITGNYIKLQQTLTLTSWDSGRWQLPVFHLPSSISHTKKIYVNVSFTPFDTTQDYHDIKDIIDTAKPERTTWYWYVIGAVLLLILFLVLFPKNKKKPAAEKVSDEGAYKEAMQQLTKLKKQYQNSAEIKLFYTDLVSIFRTYVYRKSGIQSFSKTTDDLAQQLKTLRLKKEDYTSLVQALQLSDFVKFARFQPQPADNETAFESIKNSIDKIEDIK